MAWFKSQEEYDQFHKSLRPWESVMGPDEVIDQGEFTILFTNPFTARRRASQGDTRDAPDASDSRDGE